MTDKRALPSYNYDVALYLCDVTTYPLGGSCRAGDVTSDAQKQVLVSRFESDPRITHYLYVTKEQQYALAQHVLPSAEARYLDPDALPAAYFLSARSADDARGILEDYGNLPGVSNATPCDLRLQCEVPQLRAVGVVK